MESYRNGDLIWAKMKGYPHWPARVDDASDSKRMRIFFFGTHETGWLGARSVFPYAAHRKEYAKPLKRRGFMEGLVEIEKSPRIEFQPTSGQEAKPSEKSSLPKSVPRRRPCSVGSGVPLLKVPFSPGKSAAIVLQKRPSSSAMPPAKRVDTSANRLHPYAQMDRKFERVRSPRRSISDSDKQLLAMELSLKESLTVEAPNVQTSVKILNELNSTDISYDFLKQYPDFAMTIKRACNYRQSSAVVQRALELFQSLRKMALSTLDKDHQTVYLNRMKSASKTSHGGRHADATEEEDGESTAAATGAAADEVSASDDDSIVLSISVGMDGVEPLDRRRVGKHQSSLKASLSSSNTSGGAISICNTPGSSDAEADRSCMSFQALPPQSSLPSSSSQSGSPQKQQQLQPSQSSPKEVRVRRTLDEVIVGVKRHSTSPRRSQSSDSSIAHHASPLVAGRDSTTKGSSVVCVVPRMRSLHIKPSDVQEDDSERFPIGKQPPVSFELAE